MLSKSNFIELFKQGLDKEKHLQDHVKEELIVTCHNVLQSYLENLSITDQFKAGLELAQIIHADCTQEAAINNMLVEAEYSKEIETPELVDKREDIIRNVRHKYLSIMGAFMSITTDQTYIQGESQGVGDYVLKLIELNDAPFPI